MSSLKGSKTEKNLLTAFAGESQARNRYTYFASKAKKEGFVQISHIFEETANQEKEHAKRLFKFLEGGDVEIQAAFPAGVIGSTAENLKASAAGEHHEWENMYPEFSKTAQEEGFKSIARTFAAIAVAEKQHGAAIVGICTKAILHRKSARHVHTPRHTSNCWLKTGKVARGCEAAHAVTTCGELLSFSDGRRIPSRHVTGRVCDR